MEPLGLEHNHFEWFVSTAGWGGRGELGLG
jgi:hypothetical protein